MTAIRPTVISTFIVVIMIIIGSTAVLAGVPSLVVKLIAIMVAAILLKITIDVCNCNKAYDFSRFL